MRQIDHWLFLERVFLLCGSLIVIYGLWYFIFMLPLQQSKQSLLTQLTVSNTTAIALEKQSKQIVQDAKKNQEIQNKQHQELTEQVKALNAQIAKFNKTLVTAEDLASILRKNIDQPKQLNLDSLNTMPERTVIKDIDHQSSLIEQEVSAKFKGVYFATLSYLQKLEQLNIQLFWNNLKYQVDKYPSADITVSFVLLNERNVKAAS
jgi:MSHA biogenesis protein MshJ